MAERPQFSVVFVDGPLGMGLEPGPENFISVGDVAPGSQAFRGGVEIGCYVLEINGQWTENFSQADVTRLLRKGGERTVKFTKPLPS